MSVDSQELELFRDNVRRYLENEVVPHYEQWEKDHWMPREAWKSLGDNGLLCVDMPEQYGGAGVSFHYAMVVNEEMSRLGLCSMATAISVHSDICAPYIDHLASDDLKAHWLPKMASGDAVCAIGMSEPGAGSDLANIRTSAVRDGDVYVVNGSKTFISNGQHADIVVMAVKTDPSAGSKGVSLLLIDTSLPGFSKGRKLEKLGLHSQDTSELFMDNVRVPVGNLLGEEGKGFAYMMNELPRERLNIAVTAVAASEGTLARTCQYVQDRKAFGKPLAQLQNTRFTLAGLHAELLSCRAFVDRCIELHAQGKLDIPTGAAVKLHATELQFRVADQCLQMHGGYGYMVEYPVSRAFVDARIQRIYGGANEIMKEVVAREILGR